MFPLKIPDYNYFFVFIQVNLAVMAMFSELGPIVLQFKHTI